MTQRVGHRVRWGLVWVLLAAWLVALVLGLGGSAANAVLVVALLILAYELLAADPASRRS